MTPECRIVLPDEPAAREPSAVGHKAAHLARLGAVPGVCVPPWFAVGADAGRAHLAQPDVAAALENALGRMDRGGDPAAAAADARAAILAVPPPPALAAEIAGALAALAGPDEFVAVRSSAVGEDSAEASFAGQLDSFLFVRGAEAVLDAVRRCWASAYTARAVVYRRERGRGGAAVAMGVVVQRMVRADAAGVLFTADPVSGAREVLVVNAAWGLGEGVVGGEFVTDAWRIGKADGTVHAEIRAKDRMIVFDAARGEGTRAVDVPPDRATAPCLSEATLRALRVAALAVEHAFGVPQDIEFATEGERLFILQTRPITTLPAGPEDGPRRVWDNSNIVESYAGVTTPLTFSFIRRAYATVYDQFLEIMGVPARVRRAHARLFDHLLGLIRGCVYYDLLNWYAMLRFLPGYRFNREFMESMMGVRERMADEIGAAASPSFVRRYFAELPRLLWTAARILVNLASVDRKMRRFLSEFKARHAQWNALPMETMRPDELERVYRDMEEGVLRRWKPPILSDFYAMIFYGLLRKLSASWAADPGGTLANDLLCGDEQIESSAAPVQLMEIARMIRADPRAAERFVRATPEELVAELREGQALPPPAREAFARYLDRFGDRGIGELKLETPKPREYPGFLFSVLRNYVMAAEPPDPGAMVRRQRETRATAEARIAAALGRRRTPVGLRRSTVFRWVLAHARRHIRNRENQRLARTRAFALVRRVFLALGAHLARAGALRTADDVFYLTLEEVFDFTGGTAVTAARLAELAALRRAEFDEYRCAPPPPARFVTFGAVHIRNNFRPAPAAPVASARPPGDGPDGLRGTPCCGGVVRGRVRVIRAPSDDLTLDGEILVAEKTDPGWIPLYPSVSGLLIERGSVLSHSAIVAREMGKPAIVGIAGLLETLRDGDMVEMDGAAGTVRRIA